jgi:hypothetical protein
MLNLYVSILLLIQTLTPTAAKAEDLTAALDLAQIKDVRITGEASRVEFTINDTRCQEMASEPSLSAFARAAASAASKRFHALALKGSVMKKAIVVSVSVCHV